jgi:hypothetical protein
MVFVEQRGVDSGPARVYNIAPFRSRMVAIRSGTCMIGVLVVKKAHRMTSYPYRALVIAENIAEMHGLIDSFREVYTMWRGYTDVFETVGYTMKYLGLYDEWYNTWEKSCDNM